MSYKFIVTSNALNRISSLMRAFLMKIHRLTHFTLLLFLAFIAVPAYLQAADVIDQSSKAFNFQQNLSDNGGVQAQFKLGPIYDSGDYFEVDKEQAIQLNYFVLFNLNWTL